MFINRSKAAIAFLIIAATEDVTEDVIDLRPLFAHTQIAAAQPMVKYLRFSQVRAQTQVYVDIDSSAGRKSN